MPILEAKKNRAPIPRGVLAAGAGAILGFQIWLAALVFGLAGTPYVAALIPAGAALGLLVTVSLHRRPSSRTRPLPDSPTCRRLAEEKACMDRLDAELEWRGGSGVEKAVEERIVWRELLELELQDLDERMDRIRGAAGIGGTTGKGDSHGHSNS